MVVMRGHQNGKASNRYDNRDQGEHEAVPERVGEGRNEHTETERSGPRRHGMELSSNGTVAVGLDD